MNAAMPPAFCAWAIDVQGQRRLAARFRAENLDDPPLRHAHARPGPYRATGCRSECRRSGPLHAGPQRHDRTFAELLLDLLNGRLKCRMLFEQVLAGRGRIVFAGFRGESLSWPCDCSFWWRSPWSASFLLGVQESAFTELLNSISATCRSSKRTSPKFSAQGKGIYLRRAGGY